MITPRNLRRVILRALPLFAVLLAGGLWVADDWHRALFVAVVGLTPGPAALPELWLESRHYTRSAAHEVGLALSSWLAGVLCLLLLQGQLGYLGAMRSQVDPARALGAALRLPSLVSLIAIGLAAIPAAATATLLGSAHLRELKGLPGYGLWTLVAVWALLAIPASFLAWPDSPGYVVPLFTFGLIPVMAVAVSLTNLTALGADALERRLWPPREN